MNERIRASQVRLISSDGDQLGVKSLEEALSIANEDGLDLVEVAAQADPPVCRIMDYGKFRYEQEQKAKRSRKHQATIVIKEIKMRPKIDHHDYEVKKKHVLRFLHHGDKVKVTIMFRGREMVHTDLGRKLLDTLANEIEDVAQVESSPRLDGRNMIMLLMPRKVVETKESTGAKSSGKEENKGEMTGT